MFYYSIFIIIIIIAIKVITIITDQRLIQPRDCRWDRNKVREGIPLCLIIQEK